MAVTNIIKTLGFDSNGRLVVSEDLLSDITLPDKTIDHYGATGNVNYRNAAWVDSSGTNKGMILAGLSGTSTGFVSVAKSRGTEASPSAVQDGDTIAVVQFHGYDGAEWVPTVQMAVAVDGTPGSGDVPMLLEVTNTDVTATFGTDGSLTVSGTAGLKVSGMDLVVTDPGKGISIAEGSDARMGTATLVGGAATVSTAAVTANSRIFLTGNSDGGTPGWLRVSARSAGASFTITSSSGTDTGTVAWMIMEPV